MGAGILFAMTLPGLVVLLVVLAVIERAYSGASRRSPLNGRHRPGLSGAGIDVFSAAFSPGRANELEQHRIERQLRDDEHDGAPPRARVDLEARRVTLFRVGAGER